MLFILSQMYVVIAAAREFIVGRPASSGFQPAGAAAWRLGDPPLAPQRSQKMNGSRIARWLTLSPRGAAMAFGLGGVSVTVLFLLCHSPMLAASLQPICGHLLG